MTCSITEATLRDMTFVAANMRDQDAREIGAVTAAGPTEIAATMFYASEGFRWCAYLDGQPVAAFGISEMYDGLGSGWAYGSPSMPMAMRAITVFCRRVASRLAAARFRRIEVRTAVSHDLSHRWLRSLNFSHEGTARDYGIAGIDFETYAATRHSAARLITPKT